ncbi:hypothetical protein [Nonomuraea sp. NPDC050540]|uniref:hypothetical protein n=1 Tax=Nonomuraea sp. NPDC050540 TaxID=3364367 RepID=UPI0037B080BF
MTPHNLAEARNNARHRLEAAVVDLVAETYGQQAIAIRPIFPGALSHDRVADPLPGLWAAKLLAALARAEIGRQARHAREAGHTWHEIGQALELPNDDHRALSEAAFEYMTEGGYGDPNVTWRCPDLACGQLILDYGPYNGHPDDCERGHATACERHGRELAAWYDEREGE